MPVEFKDYYKVLGVPRNAGDDAIKKAFRKLARQHHPDVAKNKKTAETKFKEINEANEVLSDPEKRRKYDELGADWDQPGRQQAPPSQGFRPGSSGNPNVHFEGTGFSDFFEQFFSGHRHGGQDFPSAGTHGSDLAQNGGDIESDLLVTLDEVVHGSTRTIRLQSSDPRAANAGAISFRVKIPPGVREGQMIRVPGKGQEGHGGGAPGNLYLRAVLARHPDFRVRDTTLYHDLVLTPWEAVLGATISVPTLEGNVSMKVPPNTVSGRELRLRGRGLPGVNGVRGDLHAVITIDVPIEITPEQKTLWEQLAKACDFDPRKNS